MPCAELFDRFVSPAFSEIGCEWAAGRLDVYEERLACEVCTDVLHEMRAMIRAASSNDPVALGGTLTGDAYSIPTAMVALVLGDAGFRTRSLGLGIPSDSFRAAVVRERPAVVWGSASHLDDISCGAGGPEEAFIERWNSIHDAALDVGAQTFLGGRAVRSEMLARLRCSVFCHTMAELADAAADVLEVARRGRE